MSLNYYKIGESNLLEIKTCRNELHSSKEHLHEELSIGFIESGASNVNVNGKNYYIEAKQAIVIYPFVSHKCQPIDKNNWKFTMLYINKNLYKGMLDNLNHEHFLSIVSFEKEDFRKVEQLINIIKNNKRAEDKEEAVAELLADIFINCDMNIETIKDIELEKIRVYIENNFLEQWKLDDLENYFGFNKFRIIRSFKNRYNVTPVAYQLQLKVNYAKHLISKNTNLAEVALSAGFYDQAYFTKEFRKAYGLTPKQYMDMY